MQSDELNSFILNALDIPDDGFTERVMTSLPPEPLMVSTLAHKITWVITAAIIMTIVFVGAKSFGLVAMIIAAAVVLAHFDADSTDLA